MEAEMARAAATAALCVLLLLTLPGLQQQQVVAASAKSEFCACYKECYPGCRHDHVPRVGCVPFCLNKCSPSQARAGWAAPASGSAESLIRRRMQPTPRHVCGTARRSGAISK